jgi:hypothetical protein
MASVFWWLVVEISWVSYGFLLLASCALVVLIALGGRGHEQNSLLWNLKRRSQKYFGNDSALKRRISTSHSNKSAWER